MRPWVVQITNKRAKAQELLLQARSSPQQLSFESPSELSQFKYVLYRQRRVLGLSQEILIQTKELCLIIRPKPIIVATISQLEEKGPQDD